MSLTYPLSDLMDKAFIKSGPFALLFRQEYSGTEGGDLLVKDRGPELWVADFTSTDLINSKARSLRARLNGLRGSLKTFYGYDPISPYPQADPSGSVLGASTVKINSIASGGPAVSLKGLPAGYVLTEGDMLAFDYGSPTARALHEVSEAATANGSGITPQFEVAPNIRPGAAADIVVTLIKPAAEMRVVPGSIGISTVDRFKSSVSFKAVQVVNA